MGFFDKVTRILDNAASEVFVAETGLDPRRPDHRAEIAKRMDLARDVRNRLRQLEMEQLTGGASSPKTRVR